MPHTVRLHRVLATRPGESLPRVPRGGRARQQLPPNGFTRTVHHLEPRPGGTFKMSFRNFTTGEGHSFMDNISNSVSNERVRYTDRFEDPNSEIFR